MRERGTGRERGERKSGRDTDRQRDREREMYAAPTGPRCVYHSDRCHSLNRRARVKTTVGGAKSWR